MIKVNCKEGLVNINEMEGTIGQIMADLCCIVDAACSAFTSDEDEKIKEFMRVKMVRTVAKALLEKNDYEENSN